jgi:hypothetical protein
MRFDFSASMACRSTEHGTQRSHAVLVMILLS